MTLDAVLLSRLQWAWVIAWHILLPAFTVGLASYIAVLEGFYFFTGREMWFRISGFWTKIFAVSFGMGVVSGVIMPFQFGTNWSRFTDATADVLSPMMAYEGLMAFFLESSFLGVLLFGRRLVPAWAHFFASLMVAFGTLLSSFWILSTNSWMQTPRGYKLVDGRFEPVDWLAIVFNPSFPYRLLHNVTAFYITTAFVVMGVGAWLLQRNRAVDDSRMMVRMALNLLIILVPLQIFLGDLHGLNTLEHQPAKLAAMEGLYDTAQPMPLTLFGVPDDEAGTMRYPIEIPNLGSLILTRSWDGAVKGLKEWPADERPPVALPFFAFRTHGGHRVHYVVRRDCGSDIATPWATLGVGLVPAVLPMGGSAWLHRGHRGLDRNRGRSSALDCLWLDAHGRFRLALTHGHGRGAVARFLHRRLSHYVSDRHRFHGRIGTPRAATARSERSG